MKTGQDIQIDKNIKTFLQIVLNLKSFRGRLLDIWCPLNACQELGRLYLGGVLVDISHSPNLHQ